MEEQLKQVQLLMEKDKARRRSDASAPSDKTNSNGQGSLWRSATQNQ